jgi:hypothetical protein
MNIGIKNSIYSFYLILIEMTLIYTHDNNDDCEHLLRTNK